MLVLYWSYDGVQEAVLVLHMAGLQEPVYFFMTSLHVHVLVLYMAGLQEPMLVLYWSYDGVQEAVLVLHVAGLVYLKLCWSCTWLVCMWGKGGGGVVRVAQLLCL